MGGIFMIKKCMVVISIVLLAVLMSGCTSAPVKETTNTSVTTTTPQNTVKYVELHMIDGSSVGGKYVSESAAFTTIVPMYIIDKDGVMSRGNGKETGITTNLIATMVTIGDPSSLVTSTLNQQAIAEKAQEKENAASEAQIVANNANASKHLS
jgi:PBP1b-binding outer membrane lipoprotein LpoB